MPRRTRCAIVAALAAWTLLGLAGPAAAQGSINVYCSVQLEWCQTLANEFTRQSGIKVAITNKGSLALRSVAELANAAAHEINNPLAVIVGQLELIEKGKNVAEGIRRVRTAALRIRDIVNHMTRITRLEWPTAASPSLPRMLDLRRSGPADDGGRGPS